MSPRIGPASLAQLLLLSQLLSPGGARVPGGSGGLVNVIPEDKGSLCKAICAEINGDDTFNEGDCYCIIGHEPTEEEKVLVSRVTSEGERAGMPVSIAVVGPDQGNRDERCLIGMATALRARARAAKRAFLAPPRRASRPGEKDGKDDDDDDDESSSFLNGLVAIASGVVRAINSNNQAAVEDAVSSAREAQGAQAAQAAQAQGAAFSFGQTAGTGASPYATLTLAGPLSALPVGALTPTYQTVLSAPAPAPASSPGVVGTSLLLGQPFYSQGVLGAGLPAVPAQPAPALALASAADPVAEAAATQSLADRVRARVRQRSEKKLHAEEAAGDPIVGAPLPTSSTTTPRPLPSARYSGSGVVVSPVHTGSVYLSPEGGVDVTGAFSSMAGRGTSPSRPSVIVSPQRSPIGSPTVIVSPARSAATSSGTPPSSPLSHQSSSSSASLRDRLSGLRAGSPQSDRSPSSLSQHSSSPATSPHGRQSVSPASSPQYRGESGARASVIVAPSSSRQRSSPGSRRGSGSSDSDPGSDKDPVVGAPNPLESISATTGSAYQDLTQLRNAAMGFIGSAVPGRLRSSETLQYLLQPGDSALRQRTAGPPYSLFSAPIMNSGKMYLLPPQSRDSQSSAYKEIVLDHQSRGTQQHQDFASPDFRMEAALSATPYSFQVGSAPVRDTRESPLDAPSPNESGNSSSTLAYLGHLAQSAENQPIVSPYSDSRSEARPAARGAVHSVLGDAAQDVLHFTANRGAGAVREVQDTLAGTIQSAAGQGAQTVQGLQAVATDNIHRVKAAQEAVREALKAASKLADQTGQAAQDAKALAASTLQTASSQGAAALRDVKETAQEAVQSAAAQVVQSAETTAKDKIASVADLGVQRAQSAIAQASASAQHALAKARAALARAAAEEPRPQSPGSIQVGSTGVLPMFYNGGQGYWTSVPSEDPATAQSRGLGGAQPTIIDSSLGRIGRLFAKAGLGVASSTLGRLNQPMEFQAAYPDRVVFKVQHSPSPPDAFLSPTHDGPLMLPENYS